MSEAELQPSGPPMRTEHDSMGEVQVPAAAKYGAQTQRAVENFPISGVPIEPTADPGAGPHQGRGGGGERRRSTTCRRSTDRIGDGHRRGRRRGGRRGVGRRVPGRRVPDRLGHVVEHEHERGAGRLASERLGEPAAVHPNDHVNASQSLERRVPVGHPPGGGRGHRLRPDPGARAARERRCDRKANAVRDGREVGPHPPHGRHAGHPRPGVRRLRRADRSSRPSACGRACPASASCPSAARRSAPASTPPSLRAGRSSPRLARAHRPAAARGAATTSPPRARATRWSRRRAHAADAGGGADQDRQRPALDGSAAPAPGWPRSASPTSSPARRSCRARSTRSSPRPSPRWRAQVIGNDAAVAFGGSQGTFELNVFMPDDGPQPARVDPPARQREPPVRRRCIDGIEANEERCRRLRRVVPVDRHLAQPLPRLREGRRDHQGVDRTGRSIREIVLDAGADGPTPSSTRPSTSSP